MAAIKVKVGEGDCPVCKREVVLRKSEGGALSYFCQHCDFQGYAKHGTEAERLMMKTVRNPVASPAPDVKPPTDPQPAPKKTGGAFGLVF